MNSLHDAKWFALLGYSCAARRDAKRVVFANLTLVRARYLMGIGNRIVVGKGMLRRAQVTFHVKVSVVYLSNQPLKSK
jgi:hypothetical protein